MTETADKARAHRMQRLRTVLDTRLDNPAAALEALLSELKLGESHPELWEELHAAAWRDGLEADLGAAYRKATAGRRLETLPPAACSELLTHAADFFQGVLGDADTADVFLERLLGIVPNQAQAFQRLLHRFEGAGDNRRLAELYGLVAAGPPVPPRQLAHDAMNTIMRVSASSPLSDDVCRKLAALVPASPSIFDGLEAHCRKTGRLTLACSLLEDALAQVEEPTKAALGLRRRLVELYLEDGHTPERAMPHVEALLAHDPADASARAAAQRLLGVRAVATRAAAVLHTTRRREPGD